MYKKVMVAIGDDETSAFALQEALNIVSSDDARLCIVHAAAAVEDGETKKSEQGANLLARARSAADGVTAVETRLLDAGEYGVNSIAEAIASVAAEWKADLLVVGTKGRRGLERLVIGSVAEKLVHTVEISILLVRPH